MSDFDFNKLNRQFKKVVNEMNKNSENDYTSKELNENYNDYDYKYDESYIKLKPVADYIDSLNIDSIEIIKQYKNYRFLSDIHYGVMSFNKKPSLTEISSTSHLPQYGPKKEKNVLASIKVYERLKQIYGFSDWQFFINDLTNNVEVVMMTKQMPAFYSQQQLTLLLANINDNIKVIDAEMEAVGYYQSTQMPHILDGKPYVIVQYNPTEQDSINDFIHKNCDYLYHSAPIVFDEKIKENGFIPASKSPAFKYPPRVFFNVNHYNWEYYEKMMNDISASHSSDEGYTNKYIVYVLKVSKIPKNIIFYADPNATDCCYSTQTVPYDCVIDTLEREY